MEPNFFGEYDAQHGVEFEPTPALQSPVVSYNLDKPMSYADFRNLPDHAKTEYLAKLKKVYGAGVRQIAEMFRMTIEDTSYVMIAHNVSPKGKRSADGDRLWKAFLGDFVPPEHPVAVQEQKPATEPDDEVIQPPVCGPGDPEPEAVNPVEAEPDPRPAPPKPKQVSTTIRAFTVDICGPVDAVIRRLTTFAALVGNLDVRITLSIDEGDAS